MRPLGLLCAIALLVGCGGSTAVRPFGGTYDLATVNGRPLPQPLYSGATTGVSDATLDAGADTITLTMLLQPFDSLTHPTNVDVEIEKIPYELHGDSLLVVLPTGSFGDGLLIRGLDSGQQGPLLIGTLRGSNVQLLLSFVLPSSTGFTNSMTSRFLFTPAP